MVSAIVVAAGASRRMGFDKLAAVLAGRSVLEQAVRALAASGEFDELVLVVGDDRRAAALEWASATAREFRLSVRFARGGAERHDSVAAGLAALDPASTLVAVHDGARPLVCAEDVRRVLAEARQTGAAALGHPVVETLKRSDEAGWVCESVDRASLWAMETPQAFHLPLLREAYASALAAGWLLTDEVSAVQAAGHRVRVVASSQLNLKITHPQDLAVADSWMARGQEMGDQPPAIAAT